MQTNRGVDRAPLLPSAKFCGTAETHLWRSIAWRAAAVMLISTTVRFFLGVSAGLAISCTHIYISADRYRVSVGRIVRFPGPISWCGRPPPAILNQVPAGAVLLQFAHICAATTARRGSTTACWR